MKTCTFAALGLAALALTACEEVETANALAEGTGAAAAACVAMVNQTSDAGEADANATVTGAEYSEAGSTIELIDSEGTRYKCLSANDGTVEELTVI